MSECSTIQTLLLIYCAFVGLHCKSLNKCASLGSLIVLPSASFELYLLHSVLSITLVHRSAPVCVQHRSRYETGTSRNMEARSDILIFGAFYVIVSHNPQSSYFHLFETKNMLEKVIHVKRLCHNTYCKTYYL
jgi:hypothetical protein